MNPRAPETLATCSTCAARAAWAAWARPFALSLAATLPSLGPAAAEPADAPEPLFQNSVVATDFDFITEDDPSAFVSLAFVGRDRREMPDPRKDELFVDGAFLFEATFEDTTLELWVNPAVGGPRAAEQAAVLLTGPLGRLPAAMRGRLSHVVVHDGDESAFGESEGRFFVVYAENMAARASTHDLEETVFHESVHATLDHEHARSDAWRAAQRADGAFVTAYAASRPDREDLAETALFARTWLRHPERLPAETGVWMEAHIPHRLAFFERLLDDLEPPARR